MSVLTIALPIALALGASALVACVWSIRQGQFDDLDSASVRILVDEKPLGPPHREDAKEDRQK
ncbi:Cytochrome oxidase maturation protein cbb3-type [Novipirellula galeiformis]|uniref:Cytochrome oxidase maturation protein cbb3-type n=1 Tax=Novipirellula galeiformis TaxID=2528004 RepID=A0A5C6CFQ6_9BACT|nr:cbb3-type cytochrome oxidase assembly protein CcoS [Novipirellula galeiformis]TWU22211.1 Cytochrome oxidase maturation protein cbb3-type [Novipirellula galeiformis]